MDRNPDIDENDRTRLDETSIPAIVGTRWADLADDLRSLFERQTARMLGTEADPPLRWEQMGPQYQWEWIRGQLDHPEPEDSAHEAEQQRIAAAADRATAELLASLPLPASAPVPLPIIDPTDPRSWTDAQIGELLADELRAGWRYVTAWKQWVRWDGKRWAVDGTESVHEVARLWVIDLGNHVLLLAGPNDDALVRKAFSYRKALSLEALVKVARRILAVAPGVFDSHPDLLNTLNGVVDLRTGQLSPHDPDLMLTKLTGAAFDPTASHEDVTSVFGCLADGDRDCVKMLFGVSATGHTGGDHLPVMAGSGGNGKSTLLTAVGAALGDYAAPVPADLVMKSAREDHPVIKTTLHGLRLAYVEETEEEGGLRLERVKAITGGAPITARQLYGAYYEFQPSHTLVLATNHRPVVNSGEHAAWRRLRLIPFPYRYDLDAGDHPQDAGLRDRLAIGRPQRDAMLAVLVAGAGAAYAAGSPETPVVIWSTGIMAATDEWRADEDVIGRFAADELVFDVDARVTLAEMFARYKVWCEQGGRRPGTDKLFAGRFEAHDLFHRVDRITPHRKVTYVGVRLGPLRSVPLR